MFNTATETSIYLGLRCNMKIEMNRILFGIVLLMTSLVFAQNKSSENWTEKDKAQYDKLKKLAHYVYRKEKADISKDSLFNNYAYFDNVLTDTVTERREKRILAFDTLFYYFIKTVDSI